MTFADLLAQLRAAVAEFGGDAKVQSIRSIPLDRDTTDPNADPSGYSRTAPGPIGASHQALVIQLDAHGPKLSLTSKDKEIDDVQRASLKRSYSKRAKVIRETGTYRGASTDELTNNPNDAIETPHDSD